MWRLIKKSAYALWNSARKNKAFFFSWTIGASILSMIFLAGILSFAAIPVGIVIGLVSGLILNHTLYWCFVLRKNGIPRDYVEKIAKPQEQFYKETIHFGPTLRKSLPLLFPAIQDIVLGYVKKNPVISKPAEFKEMIESIDIDDAGVIRSGSLKEFIYLFAQGFETAPRFGGKKYPSTQRARFFNDLLSLSFNKPDMVCQQEAPDQKFPAFTPIDVFKHAISESIFNVNLPSFRSLLIYSGTYLQQEIYVYLSWVIGDLAINSYKFPNTTLDNFLDALAEQQLSIAVIELLNMPCGQALYKDFILEKGTAYFITRFSEVLHLSPGIFSAMPQVVAIP